MADPKMIAEFKKGIITRDVDRIRAALDAGVDPATPTLKGIHPLSWLLTGNYASFATEAGKIDGYKPLAEDEFIQRGSEIISLMLDKGLKLVEDVQFSRVPFYPVDGCLTSPYTEDLCNVVAWTIRESLKKKGTAYQPDTGGFIGEYLNAAMTQQPGVSPEQHVTVALDLLEGLHDVMHEHFKNPQTEVEREIAANYSAALGYWMNAFERPPMEMILGPDAAQIAASQSLAKGDIQMPSLITQLPKKQPEEVLHEIQSMVGMEETKKDAASLVFRAQFDAARQSSGLPLAPPISNTVFEGNAGSGKTAAARHQAELLHALGLSGNKYAEINYENVMMLLGDKTGQTILKLINEADIIFIDSQGALYSQIAPFVDALTSAIDNRHGELTVFFAGNKKEMDDFFKFNPSMRSHITHYQHLPDYSSEEIGQILDRHVAAAGLAMDAAARDAALVKLQEKKSSNTRAIRSLLEQLPDKMAERLFGGKSSLVAARKEALSTITKADVDAVEIMIKEKVPLGFSGGVPAEKPVVRSTGMSR